MTDATRLTDLGSERFVSLTTFRKTGVPVATPVWIARDGDAIIALTPLESGKVKRLRNNTSVEVRACTRMGTVAPGAPMATGRAEIVRDPAATALLTGVLRRKYGLEYHIVMLIERIAARRQKARIVLRIAED